MVTYQIVTAYYKIPNKKSHDFYLEHMRRFFRSAPSQFLFYTTPDVLEDMKNAGISFKNALVRILPQEEWKAWTKPGLGRAFWERQKARDPEPYHSPELGAVWYEKKEFILRAAADCQQDSAADVYVWLDAGCVRDDRSETVFRDFGKRALAGSEFADGRIHLEHLFEFQNKDFYSSPDRAIAGGLVVGCVDAWRQHSELFDICLQEYDKAGISAISDQYVILRCLKKRPDLYKLHSPPVDLWINKWMFFLQTL